jgi:2-polyprenyl-6-methoxyphenol hydroxylase-like FAD-dependent oxidoreductase
MRRQQVLISGASIAGLATAFWMRDLGHDVTVVELADGLRRGGTAVNVEDDTVDVVRRMGLLDRVRANRLDLRRWEFKNAADVTERRVVLRSDDDPPSERDIEIERDVLLDLLFGAVSDDVRFRFGDQIVALSEADQGMDVAFDHAPAQRFDIVFGCDGAHSAVRRLWFGLEDGYAHFLGRYFSISIVDELLIERDTAQMFNVPGKAVMLNAYRDKTDVVFAFAADTAFPYDYRDRDRQRRVIEEQFDGIGWRVPELIGKMRGATNFYFDALSQIRMPSWSKGPVALVGDAAYCASPAAGRGGSLALDGAAAVADALRRHGDDVGTAFREYEEHLRPFVEDVQAEAVRFGLDTLVPMTDEAIDARNSGVGSPF